MPERSADTSALLCFIEEMRKKKFDLVVQMHGSGRFTNPLTVLMGARENAGYYEAGRYRPDPRRFIEWRPEEHEVQRWLRLLEHAGVPPKGTRLEFPLDEADWRELRSFCLRERSYVVIHPGSQLSSRRWPAERFAEVADALAVEGLKVVLTGVIDEISLVGKTRDAMRQPAIDLAGRTTLGGLAALIGGARLLVSNDTGVSHIAAAMRTPSVVIACGSDPRRWAPLDRALHRVLAHEVGCRPCAHPECPVGHPCAIGIEVGDVLNEIRKQFVCTA
jgi:ADP-heptose:LPS heptosyltransferase